MKTAGTFSIIIVILSATIIVRANEEVCKGVPDGNARPNVDDCEKFYVCLGGKGIAKVCGNGLHFNPKLLFCQHPDEAGCVPTPTLPPTQPTRPPPTSTPTQPTPPPTQPTPPPTQPTPPPTQPTPTPTDPPTPPPTQPTPPPTPPPTKPTPPPTPPPTKPTPPPTPPPTRPPDPTTKPPYPTNQPIPIPPGICKTHPLGHKINYPGDCTKFIVCISGGIGFNCPDGLHFNLKKQVCDWKENAGCNP